MHFKGGVTVMKKLRYIVLGLLVSLLLSCDARVMGSLVPVSLVELLANPQRFENKIVEVSGYLESINDLRLFLTKEHAVINDVKSSVEIFDSTDGGILIQLPCMSHYVKVTGKFSKVYKGYAHAIKDVSRIYEYDSNEFCWDTKENRGK